MTNKSMISCTGGNNCYRIEEITSLQKEIEHLSTMVSTDSLTNLFNYRHFSRELSQEIERSQRTQQPTTLIMVDIDHFKRVNDEWGHEVGNQALKLVAQCIMNNIRKLDIACRYGGEEFALILPSTHIITGINVAERIRNAIASTSLSINHTHINTPETTESHTLSLTVSLGLSTYTSHQEQSINTLIESADKQLYRAKSEGRNRTCHPTPDTQTQQVSNDEKSALFNIFK